MRWWVTPVICLGALLSIVAFLVARDGTPILLRVFGAIAVPAIMLVPFVGAVWLRERAQRWQKHVEFDYKKSLFKRANATKRED